MGQSQGTGSANSKSDIMDIASALPVPEAQRQVAQLASSNMSATNVEDISRMAGDAFGMKDQGPRNKYTQSSAAG
jgi:hypothetical protein